MERGRQKRLEGLVHQKREDEEISMAARNAPNRISDSITSELPSLMDRLDDFIREKEEKLQLTRRGLADVKAEKEMDGCTFRPKTTSMSSKMYRSVQDMFEWHKDVEKRKLNLKMEKDLKEVAAIHGGMNHHKKGTKKDIGKVIDRLYTKAISTMKVKEQERELSIKRKHKSKSRRQSLATRPRALSQNVDDYSNLRVSRDGIIEVKKVEFRQAEPESDVTIKPNEEDAMMIKNDQKDITVRKISKDKNIKSEQGGKSESLKAMNNLQKPNTEQKHKNKNNKTEKEVISVDEMIARRPKAKPITNKLIKKDTPRKDDISKSPQITTERKSSEKVNKIPHFSVEDPKKNHNLQRADNLTPTQLPLKSSLTSPIAVKPKSDNPINAKPPPSTRLTTSPKSPSAIRQPPPRPAAIATHRGRPASPRPPSPRDDRRPATTMSMADDGVAKRAKRFDMKPVGEKLIKDEDINKLLIGAPGRESKCTLPTRDRSTEPGNGAREFSRGNQKSGGKKFMENEKGDNRKDVKVGKSKQKAKLEAIESQAESRRRRSQRRKDKNLDKDDPRGLCEIPVEKVVNPLINSPASFKVPQGDNPYTLSPAPDNKERRSRNDRKNLKSNIQHINNFAFGLNTVNTESGRIINISTLSDDIDLDYRS